ncbi:MAG: cupin domain-containing protein [Denitromonas halophila]|nr:MAG: cupin domain-containing protein [Denitromonas halophila]
MTRPTHGSLLTDLPAAGADEDFRPLFDNGTVRIERIVSHHHASPPGFWYAQADDEWVMVVSGAAVLAFGDGREQAMAPGDWVLLPAGCKHRVARTDAATVWLAVHARPADTESSVI